MQHLILFTTVNTGTINISNWSERKLNLTVVTVALQDIVNINFSLVKCKKNSLAPEWLASLGPLPCFWTHAVVGGQVRNMWWPLCLLTKVPGWQLEKGCSRGGGAVRNTLPRISIVKTKPNILPLHVSHACSSFDWKYLVVLLLEINSPGLPHQWHLETCKKCSPLGHTGDLPKSIPGDLNTGSSRMSEGSLNTKFPRSSGSQTCAYIQVLLEGLRKYKLLGFPSALGFWVW